MRVPQCVADLFEPRFRLLLGDRTVRLQVLENVAAVGQVHENVDEHAEGEDVVDADDVRVMQLLQGVQFARQKLVAVVAGGLVQVDHLAGDVFALVLGLEDARERAVAELIVNRVAFLLQRFLDLRWTGRLFFAGALVVFFLFGHADRCDERDRIVEWSCAMTEIA